MSTAAIIGSSVTATEHSAPKDEDEGAMLPRSLHPVGREDKVAPQDLTDHNCINLRLPIHGGLYAWEFEKKGRELNVRVDGQLIFNTASLMLKAALDGHGLVYLTERQVAPYLADGRLVRVLADWCEPFSGYHLYYPSRRQPTPAFALLVEALWYRRWPQSE